MGSRLTCKSSANGSRHLCWSCLLAADVGGPEPVAGVTQGAERQRVIDLPGREGMGSNHEIHGKYTSGGHLYIENLN